MVNISNDAFEIKNMYFQLCNGHLRFIYELENIKKISEVAEYLLDKPELNELEVSTLSYLIKIGNITYNDTDNDILPIEDGMYDLLLVKYKKYDENYQVGAEPIDFKDSMKNLNVEQSMSYSPVTFMSEEDEKFVDNMLYPEIMYRNKQITQKDMRYYPVQFPIEETYIEKRIRNTIHEHPELVGTLDKCKYVLNKDAIDRGVFDDQNVSVLERDFFGPLINKGIIDMSHPIIMIAELKYDGVSIEADIENGHIISARTRGDTNEDIASDVTPIFQGYTFPDMFGLKLDKMGVKFEAIIDKYSMEILKREKGVNYINGRTAIIGIFGSSDAYKYRDLITLIPLATTLKDKNGEPIHPLVEVEFMNKVLCREQLLRYGVLEGNYVSLLFQIKKFVEEAEFARKYLPFMYDGVVLTFVNKEIRETLGRTNSVNNYQIAIKFNALKKNTIFLGYTFEVGQNGIITPMIHYQPVEFLGSRHVKSSGHSYKRFKDLDLKDGDIITVEYTNDVMPYVTKADVPYNLQNQNPIWEFPKICPICGADLVVSETSKSVYCPNMDCDGRKYKRMESTLSKLGIKDFAYESITALQITSISDLMRCTPDDLVKLGPNNAANLYYQLRSIRVEPIYDYKIIGSLGIKDTAIKTFKLILEKYKLTDLITDIKGRKNENEIVQLLTSIKGIGPKTATTVYDEIKYFLKDIEYILKNFNIISSYGSNLSKPKVVFTGFRDKELSETLDKIGFDADPNNSLTKDTVLLVTAIKGLTGSKVSKATKYNIPIMSVAEVKESINNNSIQQLIL